MTHFDTHIVHTKCTWNVCLHICVHAFVVQLDVLLSVPIFATTCVHIVVQI